MPEEDLNSSMEESDGSGSEESESEESDSEFDSDDDDSSYLEVDDDEDSESDFTESETDEPELVSKDKPQSDLSQLMTFLAVNKKMTDTSDILSKIQVAANLPAAPPKSASMPDFLSHGRSSTVLLTSSENPRNHLFQLLKDKGIEMRHFPAKSLDNFFFTPKEEHFKAYTQELLARIRSQDLSSLHEMKENGQIFDSANTNGEGVIHMACRQGLLQSVKFLVMEANVALRRKDDFGRTPLHDAFWASKPRFEIVSMIIKREPDLMFISDSKGFIPLDYAPKHQHSAWCDYLTRNSDSILPKELVSRCA